MNFGSDNSSGVHPRVRDDVAELCQAVDRQIGVPVLNGFNEVLQVLRDLIANVVDFLSQLAMAQLGSKLVHRVWPLLPASKVSSTG